MPSAIPLQSHDWERIVRLISANIFALLEQNELTSVARQLENLTNEKSHCPSMAADRSCLAGCLHRAAELGRTHPENG